MEPFVVGISGASCSGKTLIAKNLADKLEDREHTIIQMDSYYRDLGNMKFEARSRANFDIPDAIDFNLLINDVKGLLEGREVLIPEYNFKTHTRESLSEGRLRSISVKNTRRSVIIIEGLHVFLKEPLRELIDICVFIDTCMNICLSRRIERDTKERGRTRTEICRQFSDTVVPMYEKYVLPARKYADIIVDGEKAVEESAREIMSEFKNRISD